MQDADLPGRLGTGVDVTIPARMGVGIAQVFGRLTIVDGRSFIGAVF